LKGELRVPKKRVFPSQGLVDQVVAQIDDDINYTHDVTALEALLKQVDVHVLESFLTENLVWNWDKKPYISKNGEKT
jgi:hypothetical protein